MKILLTGPTGFIGKCFAKMALQRGHRIAALIRPGKRPPSDLIDAPNLIWLPGVLDAAPWSQIEQFQPDVCIHTAWITTPTVYLESPENVRYLEASKSFLHQVFRRAASYTIALGTCIEYQITNENLSEDRTPLVPNTLYAKCKNELRLYLQAQGIPFGWGRIFYPYGPGEHPSRLCTSIIQKLRANETITLKTPDAIKDYIYISDLGSALLTVAEHRFSGPINLGTGIGVTVKTIAQSLAEIMGKSDLIEQCERATRDPFGYVVADVCKLKSLGWQATCSLEDGLYALVNAHLNRPSGRILL